MLMYRCSELVESNSTFTTGVLCLFEYYGTDHAAWLDLFVFTNFWYCLNADNQNQQIYLERGSSYTFFMTRDWEIYFSGSFHIVSPEIQNVPHTLVFLRYRFQTSDFSFEWKRNNWYNWNNFLYSFQSAKVFN